MSELFHECGVAAIYHLPSDQPSSLLPLPDPCQTTRLMPRMLQDMQNRGQLSAGMSRYHPRPENGQLIDTFRDLGSVQEVFRLSHSGKAESLMQDYAGSAAIGHVRYATCGKNDRSYAQPFENHHFHKRLWFSFAFNGQLANYQQLAGELLADGQHHLVRRTDTEVLLHEISRILQSNPDIPLEDLMRTISRRLDGAYSIALINANGEMLLARDPLGIKPLCYAIQGPLFAAASESVALVNLGFHRNEIESLAPGHAIVIRDGKIKISQYADQPGRAHCFFEWIYFANVASSLDNRSVYLARTALGKELARLEREDPLLEIDANTIVVPVPDTSKAAADSMAYNLGVPSFEGLIRNRYSGRTFIESSQTTRAEKARAKYTPLREILEDKKVILVEDSIVRSTTMKALLERIRVEGGAREIHVRVACPPIIAPCFYGIDMSSVQQLFAPKFLGEQAELTPEIQRRMAKELQADSLRYLPIEAIARSIGYPSTELCQACITGDYPTAAGERLYQIDLAASRNGQSGNFDGRAYDIADDTGTRS
jgi:amidophosphoribosyltransferase